MKQIVVSNSSELNLALQEGNDLTIYLKSGLYRQKLKITGNNICLIGEQGATISYNDYAQKIHTDGKEYNTFRTATVTALGRNITLKNLIIQNTAGYASTIGQAVALLALSDGFYAHNCQFKAFQDTIFCAPLPRDLQERYKGFLPDDERQIERQCYQVFNECAIEGNVDFIFGCAEAVFYNCQITSLPAKSVGYVAAPATEKENENGFLFYNCEFINKTAGEKVFLARPWRDYALADFVGCAFQEHITDEAFSIWQGTQRHIESRFCCYNCTKKGAQFFASASFARAPNIERINESIKKATQFLQKRS